MYWRLLFIFLLVFFLGTFLAGSYYLIAGKAVFHPLKTSPSPTIAPSAGSGLSSDGPSLNVSLIPSMPTSSADFTQPVNVVTDFYLSYFDCAQRHFHTESSNTLEEDCPLQGNTSLTSQLITTLGKVKSGSVLCSQDLPEDVTSDTTSSIKGDKATVFITEVIGSQQKRISVGLENFHRIWKINAITCLN